MMRTIFYRSRFGGVINKLTDLTTARLGINPFDWLKYYRDPQGVCHSEIEFSKTATLWWIDFLMDGKIIYAKELYRSLVNLSSSQVTSAMKHFKTGRNYTTVEAVKFGNLRLCFSASERDKCVRLKLIDVEPRKWTGIDMEADLECEKRTIRRCQDELCGLEYDYWLLAGYLTRWDIIMPSSKRMICSGSSTRVLSWEWCKVKVKGEPVPSPNGLLKNLAAREQPLRRIKHE